MSDVKQVKVDNWGIYFLQRLKHFFNRTDYCDLTLQFQDNAQLKVHRLVLNACTEYFELLERTCEMYEDCLVMPEDLQADVVVPIVNFMYTGQLEFRMDALERLYQTSQVMNMPVLSKLLEAHRDSRNHMKSLTQSSSRKYPKSIESSRTSKLSSSTPSSSGKRTYTKAFESSKTTPNSKSSELRRPTLTKSDKGSANKSNEVIIYRDKNLYLPQNKQSSNTRDTSYRAPSPIPLDSSLYNKRLVLGEPRPTRYELPEDLDTENIFDNSFSNISYASQPLMVHPETTKQYSAKKNSFNEASSSKRTFTNTVDIVECKKVSKNDSIFEDDTIQSTPDDELYQSAFLSVKDASPKDPGQLFDQIIDNNEGPKVTIESKDKQTGNLDHAKIISEVLKRYPHLVKSNKNIKLKILNTPAKAKKTRPQHLDELKDKSKEFKTETSFTYETDVLDSKEAAKLISMGAENVKGPWICLICGTPGRALNFTSYYNFRRHLVEVHKEKPVSTICEYCGLKSYKRNYLLHHIYTKHGVPPPPQYHFPKCPMCDYIALTEGFLVKHKLTHSESKFSVRCLVCQQGFYTGNQLLLHVQKTGHKQPSDKKASIQCSYCLKVFLRDNNFFCHLKTSHKDQAVRDGLIEDSDDERQTEEKTRVVHEMKANVKHEHNVFETELEEEEEDIQYQVQQKRHDGNMHISKKPLSVAKNVNLQQKILNTGYNSPVVRQTQKPKMVSDVNSEFIQEIHNQDLGSEGNIVVINDVEYIMKENQLIPRKTNKQNTNEEYILSDFIPQDEEHGQRLQNLENVVPTTSMHITNEHSTEMIQQPKMILNKSTTINQPIQIVVSNEEEYKALMASNHSIIFDDGDTNKTLTVLTAPQNSTIDTTSIDLDNTQSNDMMIIQEDYPMNVSEAVSGDNKYVVVYSHAMDHNDPTKQFQIITPQEIGAQYVQSSAVITQNFDTITTSSSVVNANVLGSQIEASWPENSQSINNQGTIIVTSQTGLQSIKPSEQTVLKSNEVENPLIDLPETEIIPIPAKSSFVQLEQVQQSNDVTLETISNLNPEQMVVEESQPKNTEEMNIEIPAEVKAVEENTPVEETQISAEHEIESECQEEINTENVPMEISQEHQITEETVEHQDQPVEPNPPQVAEVTHTIEEPTEMSLSIEHGETLTEVAQTEINETVSTDNIDAVSTNVEESCDSQETTVMEELPIQAENAQPPVLQTKEQIQNLTSEWSEDEYDTILEEPETTESNNVNNKNVITEEPELEESIENIQHEVQKQIGEADNISTEIQNVDPPQEANESSIDNSNTDQTNAVIINPEETQEKISSLLNDWEDNDSQGDDTSINENGDDNSVAVTKGNENKDTNVETKKDDNIKSLVSDWDEEDEEDNNKES